ncbi:MAG: restriction endonuclease [Betaproteobacteria bacterium]
MERRMIAVPPYRRYELPWWSGAAFGVLLYVLLTWVIPPVAASSPGLATAASAARAAAAFIALPFMACSLISLLLAYRKRRELDLEITLAALRALPRERFEHFAAEAFGSEGYVVAASADRAGGADLVLTRDDRKVIAQCRRWRSRLIDAAALSELHSCMDIARATGCIMVTTGEYDAAARGFAAEKPLRLIGGRELERMLQTLHSPTPDAGFPAPQDSSF